MKRLSSLALILLAGCGGGGGEDPVAASPSPVAAQTPAPPPSTSAPTIREPADPVPPSRASPPPYTAPPPAERPAVTGAVFYAALTDEWQPYPQDVGIGTLKEPPHTQAYYYQLYRANGDGTGGFTYSSQGWLNDKAAGAGREYLTGWHGSPTVQVVDGRITFPGPFFSSAHSPFNAENGGEILLEDIELTGPAFSIDPDRSYELNRTHQEWTQGGTMVQLQLQSDPDPTLFRLCWHVVTVAIQRLSCGRFNKEGEVVGVAITDDSYKRGALKWETVP